MSISSVYSSNALMDTQENLMLSYADETANYFSAVIDRNLSALRGGGTEGNYCLHGLGGAEGSPRFGCGAAWLNGSSYS